MSLIHLDYVVHGKDAESLEHDVRQAAHGEYAESLEHDGRSKSRT